MINDFDVLVDISFCSEKNGGRKNMPVIKKDDYIYRPTATINNESAIYSAGIVINSWRSEIIPEEELESMQVIFLKPEFVIPKIEVNSKIEFFEGVQIVAHGIIKAINQKYVSTQTQW
jgi:hypothetical protein